MRLIGILAVAACVSAGGAVAQDACVVADDLARGVQLSFADGRIETYTNMAGGRVHVLGVEGGQNSFELELIKGFHLGSVVFYENGVLDEGSRDTYIYDIPVADLPTPVPGERLNVGVTVRAADGTTFDEGQLQAYVDADPMLIDGCTYLAMDGVIAYDTPDNYIETVRYFPQLGFGYLLNNVFDGDLSADNVLVGMQAVQ